jgi:hypothetical protein
VITEENYRIVLILEKIEDKRYTITIGSDYKLNVVGGGETYNGNDEGFSNVQNSKSSWSCDGKLHTVNVFVQHGAQYFKVNDA